MPDSAADFVPETPAPNDAHMWQRLLSQLTAGHNLTRAEAAWFVQSVFTGEAPADLMGAVLTGLRTKHESVDELAGMLDFLLEQTTAVECSGDRLDVVGTGGDGHHSVNISTMAAIVCAAAGVQVVKHGNRAVTSSAGSADVLQALGVVIDLPAAGVQECVQRAGIGFCFAPVFHSAMRHAAVVRKSLPHPTIFNLLGPMANPSHPTAMLVGCADESRAGLMTQVLAGRSTYALVVRGDDGLDEVSTSAPTRVWAPSGASYTFDTADFGIERIQDGALAGGDAEFNAQVVWAVLNPDAGESVRVVRDCVVANAAAALVAAERAGDDESSFASAFRTNLIRAREAISSGAAQATLQRWIEASAECQTPALP